MPSPLAIPQKSVIWEEKKSIFFSKYFCKETQQQLFVCKCFKSDKLALAVVVSKKIGCSVQRNKIRRRIKAIFYMLSKRYSLFLACIVIVRSRLVLKSCFQSLLLFFDNFFNEYKKSMNA